MNRTDRKLDFFPPFHLFLTNSCNTGSSPSSAQIRLSLLYLWLSTLLPPASLVSVCLWLCTSKSCYCLPLRAAYICLLSVETKETDHKAYYGARSGVHAVCMCAYGGWTHMRMYTHTHTHTQTQTQTQTLCHSTPLLPLLMWCQSHGFQASG